VVAKYHGRILSKGKRKHVLRNRVSLEKCVEGLFKTKSGRHLIIFHNQTRERVIRHLKKIVNPFFPAASMKVNIK
jgi:hypothetical protein